MKKLAPCITAFLFAVTLLPAQEIEITGEVIGVDEFAHKDENVNVLQAQIRTRNQERIMAEIGPAWFLESDIEPGDELTLRGRYLEAERPLPLQRR